MKAERRFLNIINSNRPVMVDFYTEWCNPCKLVPELLKDVKTKTKSCIRILKVDVDKNPLIASSFKVQNVPTIIIFKNGLPIWTYIGVPASIELKEVLKMHTVCEE